MATIEPYETSQGKRYRVRYRRPDRGQTDKRGFKTKRDAELFLASVEVSKARGEFIEASAARVTVGALGSEWIRRQTQLKPSSYRTMETAWRVHVDPRWGSVAIGDLRPSEVNGWLSGMTAAGKSATVVIRAHAVLAGILDEAMHDRRILSNPARTRSVRLPRKTSKARVYLSIAQVDLLARSAGHHSTLVRLLAYTGLRWGEVVGLRLSALDTLRRRLFIEENAVNVGGRIVTGTPKGHSRRSVPYPAFLSVPLAVLCEGKQRDALVFGDGEKHLRSPDPRDGWWASAIRKAKAADKDFPELTIHDLRHTAASLAISAGANVKAVQRMLGHKSAAMTLDTYADLFDDDLDAVATALDNAFSQTDVGKMWAREHVKGSHSA